MQTKVVCPEVGLPAVFPRKDRGDIDGVTLKTLGRDDAMTWEQSLAANYTEGIVALHRGHIVYERCFGALAADGSHIAFSTPRPRWRSRDLRRATYAQTPATTPHHSLRIRQSRIYGQQPHADVRGPNC